MSETRKILIWDLPTRLFHWLLVLAIVALVVTGKAGGSWMEWHGRLGLLVLGLLVFRLLWGVMGSTYARFAGFFPTPAKVAAYLRDEFVSVYVPTTPNPTGGYFVMVRKSDCVELEMSVDSALKYIVSMGVVAPADPTLPPPK